MKKLLTTLSLVCLGTLSWAATLTADEAEALYAQYFEDAVPERVSVHDPSIVVAYEGTDGKVTATETAGSTKIYCIFGSHLGFVKSYDLQNWTYFTNNISTNYATLFSTDAEWSAKGSTTYDVSGNMWAPDVVWNPAMNKWCMYMSINGDNYYSSIVLLTADDLLVDWTRVGVVVYSGFTTATEAALTDFFDVVGGSTLPARYLLGTYRTYSLNAIDPCVFFDEDGNMWMSYGSWFGGIYLLRLDESTGLRDYTYTYELNGGTATNAVSDPYLGIKLAGGNCVSGEGSYIEYFGGRYYLFITYGGLTSVGGYSMRVFSSESVTGPYTDISGDDARYTSSNIYAGYLDHNVGTRLMTYYQWDFMDLGYVAQGHNSAVVDTDGRMFLVYHTRFNDGSEGHQVRVHQLFQCANGGLTAAPFEYKGETLSTTGYTAQQIAGTYRILRHTLTDYANRECIGEKQIKLTADGSVSGYYSGSWSVDSDGVSFSITISTETYKGVLIEQPLEETNYPVLCFTGVDDTDYTLWGYRLADNGYIYDDDAIVALNMHSPVGVPSSIHAGSTIEMSLEGSYGATYTLTSTDTTLIADNGTVTTAITQDTDVTLTLTIASGETSVTTDITVNIIANSVRDMLPIAESSILAEYSTGESFNSAAETFGVSSKTGVSISFYLDQVITSDWDQVARSTDEQLLLYLAVLHYGYSDTYEAAATLSTAGKKLATSATAWTLFLNGNYYVTVSYNVDGTISFYRDGELMFTYAANTSCGWSLTTSDARTPKQIVAAMIDYMAKGQIEFLWSVTDVVIGYAVDYTGTAISDIKADAKQVLITTEGREVVVSGKAENDVVAIYDLAGRAVYTGLNERISLSTHGLYIVKVAGVSQIVRVK